MVSVVCREPWWSKPDVAHPGSEFSMQGFMDKDLERT